MQLNISLIRVEARTRGSGFSIFLLELCSPSDILELEDSRFRAWENSELEIAARRLTGSLGWPNLVFDLFQ